MDSVDRLAAPEVQSMRFGDLRIAFDDRVLRPRPWTAAQSEWAAELLARVPEGDVLELCAGVGHIGLLAVSSNQRRLVCVDLDPRAAAYAGCNTLAAGLGQRVEVREGRVQDVLLEGERFPLVIADPPWVRHDATDRFPEDPLLAIDGGEDGLEVARACLRVIESHLAAGGIALLQLGSLEQVEQIRSWLGVGHGLLVVETRDFPGSGVLVRLDIVEGTGSR